MEHNYWSFDHPYSLMEFLSDMRRNIFFILLLSLTFLSASGQNDEAYLKANAIRIDNPEKLNDSIYSLLSQFEVIMFGEMHGTNESAPFVSGLTNLLTNKDDSVQVGLEITPELMNRFLQLHNDSSIYQSEFFANPPYLDGRESIAWANLISSLNKNHKVVVFFFDTNRDEDVVPFRDTLMAATIKTQFNKHPTWKMITISGNYHNSISNPGSMTSVLKRNISAKVCSLNLEYKEGTCMANFTGQGFKKKVLGSYPSVFNSTEGYDRYLLLYSANSNYDYNGIYYTKYITTASMVKDCFDLTAIKKELKAIFDRDQKTRTGSDSAAFMYYIDSCNQVQIKSMIAKYGWMGKSLIGNYNQVLFIVIQHADSATQEKYFPILQQSVNEGESNASDMAMMQDRILMRRGKKQIYGSQVVYSKTGEQIFYPIEDEKNVNVRRAKVGLQPMEEYGKYFGIDYKLPNK
jgi:hypothetical protein